MEKLLELSVFVSSQHADLNGSYNVF